MAKLADVLPCKPENPTKLLQDPSPFEVATTGILEIFINSLRSSLAPAETTPPPHKITGFFETFNNFNISEILSNS